jgi:hypothetical protein
MSRGHECLHLVWRERLIERCGGRKHPRQVADPSGIKQSPVPRPNRHCHRGTPSIEHRAAQGPSRWPPLRARSSNVSMLPSRRRSTPGRRCPDLAMRRRAATRRSRSARGPRSRFWFGTGARAVKRVPVLLLGDSGAAAGGRRRRRTQGSLVRLAGGPRGTASTHAAGDADTRAICDARVTGTSRPRSAGEVWEWHGSRYCVCYSLRSDRPQRPPPLLGAAPDGSSCRAAPRIRADGR